MATPPTAPDPYALTAAQTRINQQNANFNGAANSGSVSTPIGSSQFTSRVDPATGATIWDQNISLAPDQQALLTQQNAQDLSLGSTGTALAGQVGDAFKNPLDMSKLPALQTGISADGLPQLFGADDLLGARNQVQDALYQRQTSYLDPQYQQREGQFQQRAASQGLVEGSEAWRQARDQFMRERAFDYDRARTSAITGGMDEMQGLSGIARGNRSDLFGERTTQGNFGNNARTQALSEALTARMQPLKEYNAVRDATKVTLPQFNGKAPVSAQAADLSSNVNTNFQNQVDLYNAQQTSQNAQREGLVGLGGNLLNGALNGTGIGGALRDAAGRLIGGGTPSSVGSAAGSGVGSAVGAAGAGALTGALGEVLGGATLSGMAGAGGGAAAGLSGLTGLGSGTIAANTGGMGAALAAGGAPAAGAAPAASGAASGSGLGATLAGGAAAIGGGLLAYNGIKNGNEAQAALGGGVAAAGVGSLMGLQGLAALGPPGLIAAGVAALAASLTTTNEFGNAAFKNYWNGVQQGRNVGESDPNELAQGFINLYRTNKYQFPGQAQYGRTGNEDFLFDMTQQVNQAVQGGKVPPDATPGMVYEQVVKPWLSSMGGGTQDQKVQAVQDFMMTDLVNSFMTGKPISNAQIKNDSKFRIVSERPVYAGQAPQQGAQTLAEPMPWMQQGGMDYSQMGLMGGF